MLDTLPMGLGNPRQRPDVVAVLVCKFLEFVELSRKASSRFTVKASDSFVYRYIFVSTCPSAEFKATDIQIGKISR